MEKQKDITFVHRHVSQLKILARLLEHELDAGQGKDLVIDRELGENFLDTLEIFIEDIQGERASERQRERATAPAEKAPVTRLN